MTSMREFITLTEHDLAVNRVWQNAHTLQSDIKYLNIDDGMKQKLTASLKMVTDYLDALHSQG